LATPLGTAHEGGGKEGMLASLGPRLVKAGVPAVLAIRAGMSPDALADFMTVFFRELQQHGQVDRAAAAGRVAFNDKRDDRWKAAIYLRLASGLLWYYPGFEMRDDDSVDPWDILIANIDAGLCTPILGPGLLEPFVGSQLDVARRWAEQHRLPTSRHCQKDLPQVAQELAVLHTEATVRLWLKNELQKAVCDTFSTTLPQNSQKLQLEELLKKVGQEMREDTPDEYHKVLAGLPLPVYVTTTPDNLLYEALEDSSVINEDGKKIQRSPVQEFCRWTRNPNVKWPKSIYDEDPNWKGTIERPLVYHLFGGIRVQNSVVLTEDNFFDYLHGVTLKDYPIPSQVNHRFNDSALLILGFNLHEWAFRVLLRSIMGQPGNKQLGRHRHFAVQIDPEDAHVVDPERSRQYLERQFGGITINIYWGGIEDFVKTLRERWNEQNPHRPI
jgi:hypothetical protein